MYIRTQALTKSYGTFKALDACDLHVDQGEVFGLLGPNGAGKTTLLRLLLGFLRPSSGTASIDGLDTYRRSVDVHRRLSYLPGEVRLYRQMTGKRVIQFLTRVRGAGDGDRALRIADFLELDTSRRVAFMSTGMRQKLALAITFAAEAPLLILDEPTSNLDPNVRHQVALLVKSAQREGRTVVFSSHVLTEVEECCDRVVILRQGKLVHEQSVADLRRQHRIYVWLTGPLPEVPPTFRNGLRMWQGDQGETVFQTPGELRPLLGWLSTLPMSEVRIEPVGLRAVYERFHPPAVHPPSLAASMARRDAHHPAMTHVQADS